jgi:hypothetical protein
MRTLAHALLGILLIGVVGLVGACGGDDNGNGNGNGTGSAPEAVYDAYVEAFNARDAEAVEALLDPDVLQPEYDATDLGFGVLPALEGRDAVMANMTQAWDTTDPVVETYEYVEVSGNTVTVEETLSHFDGSELNPPHVQQTTVSDDGLITVLFDTRSVE